MMRRYSILARCVATAVVFLAVVAFAVATAVDLSDVWSAMSGYFKPDSNGTAGEYENPLLSGDNGGMRAFVDPFDPDLTSRNWAGMYDGNEKKIVLSAYENGYGMTPAEALVFANQQMNAIRNGNPIDERIENASLYNAYAAVVGSIKGTDWSQSVNREGVCGMERTTLDAALKQDIEKVWFLGKDGKYHFDPLSPSGAREVLGPDARLEAAYQKILTYMQEGRLSYDKSDGYSIKGRNQAEVAAITADVNAFVQVQKTIANERWQTYEKTKEALFGKGKAFDAYCGNPTKETAQNLLDVCVNELNKIVDPMLARLRETETAVHELFHAHMNQIYPDASTYNLFGVNDCEGFATVMTWLFARDQSQIGFSDYESNFLSDSYRRYFEAFVRNSYESAHGQTNDLSVEDMARALKPVDVYNYLDAKVGPNLPTGGASGNESGERFGGGTGSGEAVRQDETGSSLTEETSDGSTGGAAAGDDDGDGGSHGDTVVATRDGLYDGSDADSSSFAHGADISIAAPCIPYRRTLYLFSGDFPGPDDFKKTYSSALNIVKGGSPLRDDLAEYEKMRDTMRTMVSELGDCEKMWESTKDAWDALRKP